MTLPTALSVSCIILSLITSAMYVRRLKRSMARNDLLTAVIMWYIAVIYTVSLLPDPNYGIRAGIYTRVGVLLLVGLFMLRARYVPR